MLEIIADHVLALDAPQPETAIPYLSADSVLGSIFWLKTTIPLPDCLIIGSRVCYHLTPARLLGYWQKQLQQEENGQKSPLLSTALADRFEKTRTQSRARFRRLKQWFATCYPNQKLQEYSPQFLPVSYAPVFPDPWLRQDTLSQHKQASYQTTQEEIRFLQEILPRIRPTPAVLSGCLQTDNLHNACELLLRCCLDSDEFSAALSQRVHSLVEFIQHNNCTLITS